MESDSETVLIDICSIAGAAGALAYEETWWHVLEVRVREGCVTPALPAKLGRGPGPCWEEQCFRYFVLDAGYPLCGEWPWYMYVCIIIIIITISYKIITAIVYNVDKLFLTCLRLLP